jgi:hypothetical protein
VALEPRSSLGTMMSRRSNAGRRKESNAGQGVREESLSPPQGWRAASRRAGGEDDGGDVFSMLTRINYIERSLVMRVNLQEVVGGHPIRCSRLP